MKTYDLLTEAEKQKIEYEIKAKNEASSDELSAWGCAGFILTLAGILIYELIKSLTN